MSRVRGDLVIARRPEQVFAIVADQRNEPRYNPAMTAVTLDGDEAVGTGSRFTATLTTRGRPLQVVVEYTAFEPPHRLASRSTTDGMTIEGELRCAPHPDGTLFSWDWQLRLPGPLRLVAPLAALIGSRQERRIWTGLKHYLEAEPRRVGRSPSRAGFGTGLTL